MRDLSIRGAGNLLGAQQHGFIDSVGFDLYSQMLKEAIEERRGVWRRKCKFNVEMNLDLDAYIPDQYITDGRLKIEMYKRFRGIEATRGYSRIAGWNDWSFWRVSGWGWVFV